MSKSVSELNLNGISINSSLSLGSARLVPTSHRKSVAFLHNEALKENPKAYAYFDGRFISCNEMFSNITNISMDEIKSMSILSILKFDSFEGPQTVAYTFDELASKASREKEPPEFHFCGPLGTIRDGLLEKDLELLVKSERYQIDDEYCLTVYLKAPNPRKISNASSRSVMGMSYGSLNELEVMESSAGKRYNVMVVDDSIGTLKLIQRQISNTGHDVSIEQDRVKALETLKTGKFDVALFEISLSAGGSMNGLQIAHEWRVFERIQRNISKPLIIIATSNDYDDSMFMEALNAGFDGFIVKPFTVSDLLSIVLMINDERRGK